MILLLLACTGQGGETGDTSAPSYCDEAPVETFETFGAGFITESCQTCHASTTANRNGAPEAVVFDAGDGEVDVTVVWSRAADILRVATGDSPTMPPMGGTSKDDRYRLEAWLTCAAEGT